MKNQESLAVPCQAIWVLTFGSQSCRIAIAFAFLLSYSISAWCCGVECLFRTNTGVLSLMQVPRYWAPASHPHLGKRTTHYSGFPHETVQIHFYSNRTAVDRTSPFYTMTQTRTHPMRHARKVDTQHHGSHRVRKNAALQETTWPGRYAKAKGTHKLPNAKTLQSSHQENGDRPTPGRDDSSRRP